MRCRQCVDYSREELRKRAGREEDNDGAGRREGGSQRWRREEGGSQRWRREEAGVVQLNVEAGDGSRC
eukprot:273261-Hanusia_phi.AAC.1